MLTNIKNQISSRKLVMKTHTNDYKNIVNVLKTNKKINVIGPPGSGKTTLCEKISVDLQMNLIKLDDILFDRNCNLIQNKKEVLLKNLATQTPCIMDGTYHSLFCKDRIELVDQFVMIEINFFRTFLRIIKRTINKKKMACGEKLTFKLIKFLCTYYLYKQKSLKNIIPKNKLLIYKI